MSSGGGVEVPSRAPAHPFGGALNKNIENNPMQSRNGPGSRHFCCAEAGWKLTKGNEMPLVHAWAWAPDQVVKLRPKMLLEIDRFQ